MKASNVAARVNETAEQPRKQPQKRILSALAQLRKAVGWTQENLGAHIGASRRSISRWENGGGKPAADIRDDLAKALKVTNLELDAVIAHRLSLSEVEALVARREFSAAGIENDSPTNEDSAASPEPPAADATPSSDAPFKAAAEVESPDTEQVAVVVLLYPKDENQAEPADVVANDNATPTDKRRTVRLIDCTKLESESESPEASHNSEASDATPAPTPVKAISSDRVQVDGTDQPKRAKAKKVRTRKGRRKSTKRRKGKQIRPIKKRAAGQLPLFGGDPSAPMAATVGG
ncbi:MAG: helix-turn-helix domain-containing protein [Myxococcota bacterium]